MPVAETSAPVAPLQPAVESSPVTPVEAPITQSQKPAFERGSLKVVPTIRTLRAIPTEIAAPVEEASEESVDASLPAPVISDEVVVETPTVVENVSIEPAAVVPVDVSPEVVAPIVPEPTIEPVVEPVIPAPAPVPEEPPAHVLPSSAAISPAIDSVNKPSESVLPAGPEPLPEISQSLPFGGLPQPSEAASSFMTGTFPQTPTITPEQAPAASVPSDFSSGAWVAEPTPSAQEILARLAKPEPEPTTQAPLPTRSSKPFILGAGILLTVLGSVGLLFLRHPKDLKQMTELGDGRARLGAEPVDEPIRLPPSQDVNSSDHGSGATPESSVAAPQVKLDEAIKMVKDFPLDGDRGTVGQWLQYSYTATPDSGQESWSANETAEKTYLVEYRFTPSARGAAEIHYLFEADMARGFVMGKNSDAQSMLAGGSPAREESSAKTPQAPSVNKRRASVRRKAAQASAPPAREQNQESAPKDVEPLPLPADGELHPPTENDGSFGADTVNSSL
jgi:hypothetical protein